MQCFLNSPILISVLQLLRTTIHHSATVLPPHIRTVVPSLLFHIVLSGGPTSPGAFRVSLSAFLHSTFFGLCTAECFTFVNAKSLVSSVLVTSFLFSCPVLGSCPFRRELVPSAFTIVPSPLVLPSAVVVRVHDRVHCCDMNPQLQHAKVHLKYSRTASGLWSNTHPTPTHVSSSLLLNLNKRLIMVVSQNCFARSARSTTNFRTRR